MFDPDEVKLTAAGHRTSTPYVPVSDWNENFQAGIGQTIDRFLPFSSLQDPNSTYGQDQGGGISGLVGSMFGTMDRKTIRSIQLDSLFKNGVLPQELRDEYSTKFRSSTVTNWDGIAKFVNEKHDEVEHIMTDEEYMDGIKEEITNRDLYAEDVFSRSSGYGTAGRIAGSLTAMAVDPVTIMTLPVSGPLVGIAQTSRTMFIVQNAARIAAFNMAIQVPMEFGIQDWNENLDLEYTWQDSLINIGATGVLSGTVGGISANLGYKLSKTLRGRGVDFLSKDRESLVESFKKIGFDEEDAQVAANYQWEQNNLADDPVKAVANDLEIAKSEGVKLTVEEEAIRLEASTMKEAEVELRKTEAADRKAKAKQRKETKAAATKNKAKVKAKEDAVEVKKKSDAAIRKSNAAQKAAQADNTKETRQAAREAKEEATKAKAATKRIETAAKKAEAAAEKAAKKKASAAAAAKKTETIKEKAKVEAEEQPGIPIEEELIEPVIDADELEAKGRTIMNTSDGKFRIQKNEDGMYEVWKGSELIDDSYDDIEDIIIDFSDVSLNPMNNRRIVENLERKQDEMVNSGREIEDAEPSLGADTPNTIDDLFERLPDDMEVFVNGEPVRAKNHIDDFDDQIEELNDVVECIING